MKIFDGTPIEVQVGGGSTIYVCNFPSTADEQWLRDKFQLVEFLTFQLKRHMLILS